MRNEDYAARLARTRRRHARRTRAEHRQSSRSPRRHRLQRRRRNSAPTRPGSGDARRPHRFVARRDRATDNAIGSAVMMEAIRILQAVGVKPRRTIRLRCGAAKNRLLGSQAYVRSISGWSRTRSPPTRTSPLLQHRFGHRPRARRVGVRSARGGGDSARGDEAIADTGFSASTPRRAVGAAAPFDVVQRGGLPGIGIQQIRSSTARTRGTPTWIPTSASSKTMRRSRRW